MARTKNQPGTAPSAAHAARDPASAPVAPPAPDSPAAAVCAALAANPAATVAVIADAAGTGRPAARDALLAMEKDGTATRARGGKPGIPDTWTLAGPAQDDTGAAEAAPEDEQDGQPGDRTASSPDSPGGDEMATRAGHDGTAETASPGQRDAGNGASTEAAIGDSISDAPGPWAETPAPRHAAQGWEQDDETLPDGEDPQAAAGQGGDGPPEDDAAQESAGEAPDPALVSEITGRTGQIKAAAAAIELVLTETGDLKTALAGMDEICEQAARARRSLKAVTDGTKTAAARPGGLRDKVLAHLASHPAAEFTPHEIHKVLGNSSGAIANALDTLVRHGEAELTTEKPRRFRRAAGPAEATPGSAGSEQDSAEIAGAA